MVAKFAPLVARYGYEAELLELLEQLVRDMDRKIERQKERAAKDNAPRIPSATEQAGLDALQAREKGACFPCSWPPVKHDIRSRKRFYEPTWADFCKSPAWHLDEFISMAHSSSVETCCRQCRRLQARSDRQDRPARLPL